MALPAGVTTATLTFGSPASGFAGEGVSTSITVVPSVSLTHIATGAPLLAFSITAEASEGMPGQVTLPHTDQDGFQDANGNAFKNWAYTVTGTHKSGKLRPIQFDKVIQLPAGNTTVDLDLIPKGDVLTFPVTAPVARVTDVAGLTGSVSADALSIALGGTGGGGAGATNAGVAAFITEAGETKTALDTNYGRVTFTEDAARAGLFYMSNGTSVDGPLALASPTYKTAALGAGSSRLRIVNFGDSTNDGFGTPGGPDSFTKTWPQLVTALLRENVVVAAGGRGWVPSSHPLDAGNYVYDDVSVLSGGTSADAIGGQVGVPGALWLQPGNGTTYDTVRWNLAAGVTAVDVVTTGYPDGTLIITSANSPADPNPVIDADGFRTLTRITNPGSWVQLEGGAGIASLGLIEYVGDDTAGVTHWNLSQGAMAAHEYAYWLNTPGEFSTAGLVEILDPHVALVNLGANDYESGRTATELADAITTLHTKIVERAPSVDVVFIIRPLADGVGETWAAYSETIVTTAATLGAHVLDLRGFAGSGYFIADGVHFTEAGNAAYADSVLDYLKVAA